MVAPIGVYCVAMWFARALVAIRRNRVCYPATLTRNLSRMFGITSVIVVLDAAAIIIHSNGYSG